MKIILSAKQASKTRTIANSFLAHGQLPAHLQGYARAAPRLKNAHYLNGCPLAWALD
jgi:hypothetical protein